MYLLRFSASSYYTMLAFLAMALSFVSALAVNDVWSVSSVALTYVSGTFPDTYYTNGLVSQSLWHDTVTSPLVLRFSLVRTPTATLFPLSTPSSSWLQVTSANAPSTLSSAVVVSSPTISSDQSTLNYTLTFSGAYGGYNITFDPTQLTDSQPQTGAFSSSAPPSTSYSTLTNYVTFLAGYAPSVSIVNQGAVLTNTWLDPYSVNNVLTITSGSSSIGFYTTALTTAPSSPCTSCPQTNYSTPVAALSFTSIAYTSTGVTYNLSMLSANGPTPGSYPLSISAGLYQRSDGVYNFKVTQTVKVGFRPQIMFKDTSNYQGLDTSSCVSTPTFTSATERNVPAPTEYWFNADLSAIEMWVLPGLTAASASTGIPIAYMGEVVDYEGSGSPASLDSALGVTATSRPGASARSGGIQSSAAATSRSNGLYVGFPIATSGLSPGRYSFVIPAGTFKSVTGVYNARTVASLNIGFVPRIQVRANDGTDATGSWLDTSGYYSTYNLTLLPSVGYVLASPSLYTTGTAATIFDPITGGQGSGTTQTLFTYKPGQFTTASATFTMSLAGFVPAAALPLNVSSQALLRSDGVYSTFTFTSLKVGFVPSMSFSDQYSIVSNFLPSSYSLTYTVPPGTGSPTGATWFSPTNSSVILSIGTPSGAQTVSSASPATTSGLFSGVTLGFNPTTVFSGSSVLSTPGFANYSLSLSSLSPGVYAVPIAPGSVCTALGVCNSRGLAYLFVGYDITTQLETLPSFSLVNASFNPADFANAFVSVPMFTPIDGYTSLVSGVSSASSWRLNISAGTGFYFPATTVSTFAAYTFDTSVCNSCSAMSEPAVNFLNAPSSIGGGTTPCTMSVTSDARTTYSAISGGSNYATVSTTPGCTTGIKSWTSGIVAGPFGKYILRVPSGSLQRDDGVFNAQLEYPVVFGVPLSVLPQTLSSSPTASYPWLSPVSQYQLAISVPTFPNAVTFSTSTQASPPPYSYNTSGSLFYGQSSLPFQPGMFGLAPSAPSSAVTSTLMNYGLSFDSSVSFGQRLGYISPGIFDFTPTTGGAKIRNAASYFTISVGFLPTLSLVDGMGSVFATSAPSGITNGKSVRSGNAISGGTATSYVATGMTDTYASSLYFSVAYPSGLFSQIAALSPPSFVDMAAVSVTKCVGGTTSLCTSGVISQYTTPYPYPVGAYTTTIYPSPAFISNHSGTFALNWQIAGPTFSPATGVVGLTNAISNGVSTTYLSSLGIDGGKLCVAGICNAGVSLTVPMAINYISAAGAFPAILSPVSTTVSNLGINNLFGWLDGDGNETPFSFPLSTQASSVKVYFTFNSAPSGTPTVVSSSPSLAVSTGVVLTTTTLVYTITGLSTAGQGKYDFTISPSDGSFQPQTVRVYYGFDVRAYPYVQTDVISSASTSIITTPGEMFRSSPNTLSISKTDINLAFPGLTFTTATIPFSSLITSVTDSFGRSVLSVITCYSSSAPTPCSVATPIGLTFPVTSASAPFSNPTTNPFASPPTLPPPSMYCGTSLASGYTLCGAFAYPINVGGLTDGSYTFTLTADPTLVKDFAGNTPTFNTTFTVIIDRTPPVASSTTSTFSPTAGLLGQAVRIPPSMFVDAITPFSKLSFALFSPVPGWSLVNGSTLTTGSLTVPRSDAPLVFLIQARDQAGNTAVAPLTVAISAPISSTLAAADIRGATALPGQALKVSPAADGSVTLTLTATFGAPVGPITPANLACSFSSSVNGASSVLLGVSSSPCGASSIIVSPGDGVTKSRKFIFTVVIPASYAALILGNGAVQQMSFNIAGHPSITSAAGVAVEKLYTPTYVLLDGRAPTFGQGFSLNYILHPTVGVYYSQALPYPLFSDNLSPPQSISLISATPSTQFGLTFSPGKQGIAAITGKVTAMPTSGLITWAITAQDEAGNIATDARSLVLNVTTTPSTGTPILTMKSTPLTFTKGGAAINIDALASISNMPTAGFPEMGFGSSTPWGTSPAKIVVVLTSPDAGVPDSSCIKVANSNADCEYVASGAAFSVVSNFDADSGSIVTVYTPSSSTLLTAATINSFLVSLQYTNTRTLVSGGNRVVSVYVTSDATGHIAASATRTITVTTVNFAPVVAPTASTVSPATYVSYCPTCSSPTAPAIPLFTSVVISDTDDAMMTSASVSLASCDPSRDLLYVGVGTLAISAGVATQPGTFGGVVVDSASGNRYFDRSVYGTWFPSTCTLLIKPIGSTASIASFSAALSQVTYTNLQPTNPTGWSLNAGPLSISSYLTRGVSRAYSVTITDAGAGGRSPTTLNSTSIAATGTLWVEKYDTPAVINSRIAFGPGGFLYNKDVLAKSYYSYDSTGVINKRNFYVDRTASSATIVLNLGVSSVNGTFAGGAITDVDSPLISSAAPAVTCTGCSSSVSSQFNSASGALTVTITTPSLTTAGSVAYTFTWATGVTTVFNVDFLNPGCTLTGASNVVTSSLLTTTLPSNSLCVFPPTVVSATANTTVISLGDFAASDATLSAAAASLSALGVPVSQQITAMTAQRVAARGASSVTIPPSSIVGAGSASITTSLPSSTQQGLLNKLPGSSSIDLSLGLILGPAGQAFSSPVRVCIFVGDTASGYYRALYTSSQVSTTDPSKGFGPLTLLSNQAFNPATGQLCADTTHFSFFGPGLVPLPATPYVPKSTGMGGACPNTCSGQGTCRKDGKCQCFAGFMGYDCSSRACPSGASWGQSSGAGVGYFGNDVTAEPYASAHLDAECSGRGLCDRTKAACTCFAGFEGPACQRIACPKGCSGHGKCRFLSELPKAVGYSSWEAKRVQKCVCDAGYTGADCSQRLCPFGDDPETICADTARQVQRVSLYFGSSPTSPFLPTGASITDLVASAQLALRFKAVDGATYTTNAIGSATVPVWGSTSTAAAAAATAMATALTSLPRGAVTGVSIAADFTSSTAARTFDVTFTGPTNTGNEALMTCATNSDGYTLGCQTPGCRPFFRQPRLLNTNPSVATVTNYITVAPAAILLQPAAMAGGNTAATVGQWGVQTTFTLSKLGSGFTYSFSSSSIYGTSDGKATVTSPLPPLALRSTIAGPYGLLLSIVSDSDLNSLVFTGSTTSVTVAYSWSLPTCNVTLVSSAAVDLEKAECANRGVCDRTLGQCKCFEGYSGSACNAQVSFCYGTLFVFTLFSPPPTPLMLTLQTLFSQFPTLSLRSCTCKAEPVLRNFIVNCVCVR